MCLSVDVCVVLYCSGTSSDSRDFNYCTPKAKHNLFVYILNDCFPGHSRDFCSVYVRLLGLNPIRLSAAVLTKRFIRVLCQIASYSILFIHLDLCFKPSYCFFVQNFIADVTRILKGSDLVIILTLKRMDYF